ncbi:AER439Wp [Eremothecium gossypii ATCC 10895]|uniref:AER439Wp n=1 Tax=Eremothecium gossypii (strain ATCC 10895 / CBS 109.51 / FGSC 9923 / NRRL Y-1056) TaxID=284811 RepID=Q755S9_EREGS|nr:AER439Wp [Eremothecium gossypii ATCC 10895]AAS53118.1 AER439Wp [Eremothecium gossypii ATCC 10895]AEY97427.1 FAER439Wp [Eremothecium gossypii FDAG1]
MSKLFIPTVNCGKAHNGDIFDVAVCNAFTVTCSGDGHIKLWKNKLLDGEVPKEHCVSHHVNKTGVHHVDVLHTVERSGVEICVIACVAFDGSLHFYSVNLGEWTLTQMELLSSEEKQRSYWSAKWHKSTYHSQAHKFVATEVSGNTRVWRFHPFSKEVEELKIFEQDEGAEKSDTAVKQQDDELELQPHFTLHGDLPAASPKFATCVDVSVKNLVATGFSDGSVVIAQLSTLRPIYNFEGFGLQGTQDNSNTVRALKFSPLGGLLAVANDSGSFGCVTLYETEYGEPVGSLTVPMHSNQQSIVSVAHSGWVFGLSFNSSGEYLASCGYDAKVRVWDVKLREHVSTLHMSSDDIEDERDMMTVDEHGTSLKAPPVLGVCFVDKGVRGGMSADINEGLCCVCLDRSIRWYREAGGI